MDFIRTYADRCHHGKEEDILFREVKKKDMPDDLERLTDELVQEHVQGREMVAELEDAGHDIRKDPAGGSSRVVRIIRRLIGFYPEHIRKEDEDHFHQCMEHFSRQEMDAMLREFEEFEKKVLHEKYEDLVERLEE